MTLFAVLFRAVAPPPARPPFSPGWARPWSRGKESTGASTAGGGLLLKLRDARFGAAWAINVCLLLLYAAAARWCSGASARAPGRAPLCLRGRWRPLAAAARCSGLVAIASSCSSVWCAQVHSGDDAIGRCQLPCSQEQEGAVGTCRVGLRSAPRSVVRLAGLDET
jgi:hypothetical protein